MGIRNVQNIVVVVLTGHPWLLGFIRIDLLTEKLIYLNGSVSDRELTNDQIPLS